MEQSVEKGTNRRAGINYPTPPPSKNTLRKGFRIEQVPRNQRLANTTPVLISKHYTLKNTAFMPKNWGFGAISCRIGPN